MTMPPEYQAYIDLLKAQEEAYTGPYPAGTTIPSGVTFPTTEPEEEEDFVCTSGTVMGAGAGKYTCINNKWVSTPEEEEDKICNEGEVIGSGTERFTCQNNSWVRTPEHEEELPEYPDERLWGMDYPVGSPEWMEAQYESPYMGYMTGLGLYGTQGRRPYQAYQEQMYGPLSRLYDLSSQFAASRGQPHDPYMGSWAQPYTENPFAMYGQARGMLGQAAGMTEEQRASYGLQGPTAALQDLMGMGTRQQFGRPGAEWLAGRLPQEQEAYIKQYPQQQGPSFLDYVMGKYGLSF